MVRKWTKEGTIYTWWKNQPFNIYQRQTDGSYYQLNKDVSIYPRELNAYYYWSKPLDLQ
jgi:hypothetical protein